MALLALAGALAVLALVLAGESPSDRPAGSLIAEAPSPSADGGPPDAGGSAALDVDYAALASCATVQPASASGSDQAGATPPEVVVDPASSGDRRALSRLTRRGAARVERLRGLSFDDPLDVAFLDDRTLGRRIGKLASTETRPRLAELEERLLIELGAIPAGTDLEKVQKQALESQVAGLYVPRTKELLVRSGDRKPGTVEELTVAHELEHALADQALGLPLPERGKPSKSDSIAARQALIEGDATLSMQLYATEEVSLGDQLGLSGDEGLADADADFAELPDFLQRQLVFPYTGGLAYVCELAARDGVGAIDEAYVEPPQSTWEIMFPGADPGARPERPGGSASPGEEWRREVTGQIGAAELSWLFAAPGGETDRALVGAGAAVREWTGGEATLWTKGEQTAVGVSLTAAGPRLCGAVRDWYAAANPGAEIEDPGPNALLARTDDRTGVVFCLPGTVRVGIAPRLDQASALASSR